MVPRRLLPTISKLTSLQLQGECAQGDDAARMKLVEKMDEAGLFSASLGLNSHHVLVAILAKRGKPASFLADLMMQWCRSRKVAAVMHVYGCRVIIAVLRNSQWCSPSRRLRDVLIGDASGIWNEFGAHCLQRAIWEARGCAALQAQAAQLCSFLRSDAEHGQISKSWLGCAAVMVECDVHGAEELALACAAAELAIHRSADSLTRLLLAKPLYEDEIRTLCSGRPRWRAVVEAPLWSFSLRSSVRQTCVTATAAAVASAMSAYRSLDDARSPVPREATEKQADGEQKRRGEKKKGRRARRAAKWEIEEGEAWQQKEICSRLVHEPIFDVRATPSPRQPSSLERRGCFDEAAESWESKARQELEVRQQAFVQAAATALASDCKDVLWSSFVNVVCSMQSFEQVGPTAEGEGSDLSDTLYDLYRRSSNITLFAKAFCLTAFLCGRPELIRPFEQAFRMETMWATFETRRFVQMQQVSWQEWRDGHDPAQD